MKLLLIWKLMWSFSLSLSLCNSVYNIASLCQVGHHNGYRLRGKGGIYWFFPRTQRRATASAGVERKLSAYRLLARCSTKWSTRRWCDADNIFQEMTILKCSWAHFLVNIIANNTKSLLLIRVNHLTKLNKT